MKVTYFNSACIQIENEDVSVLCDPWFSEGIYYGSWYKFPKCPNMLALLERPTHIYISHIHPDHYDSKFLKELILKYPESKIIIPNFKINYLSRVMKADGFDFMISDHIEVGGTQICIEENYTGSASDVDSYLIIKDKSSSVLNANDCVYSDNLVKSIQSNMSRFDIREFDLMCLAYTGAGPYPQCYFDLNDPAILEEANKKKNKFIARYLEMKKAIPSKNRLPFAGKYLLGGSLSKLNNFRGISDPVEICEFDDGALIPEDFGGVIDLPSMRCEGQRLTKYSQEVIDARIKDLINKELDFERYIKIPHQYIPFQRLIKASYKNALKKSEVTSKSYLRISTNEFNCVVRTDCHEDILFNFDIKMEEDMKLMEINIDYRLLFLLIIGVFHWDNAEIGSLYLARRINMEYDQAVIKFLNFFSVIG